MRKGLRKTIKRIWKRGADDVVGNLPDMLERRQALKHAIERKQEDGRIAVVFGGVDCDGGMWDNRVDLIPANVVAFIRWENLYEDGAEGPQWHHIARPSEVEGLEKTSRDLGMEAFENGHQHVYRI